MKNYNLAITYKIINILLYCTVSLIFGLLPQSSNVLLVSFFTAVYAMLVTSAIMILSNTFPKLILSGKVYKTYCLRAIFNTVALVTWLYAVQTIGLNQSTVISYMFPVFTLILARIFCNEIINKTCLLAIFFSFIGVLVVMIPDLLVNPHKGIGNLMALLSTIFWSGYDIVTKKQASSENYLVQNFYNLLFSSIIMLVLLIFQSDVEYIELNHGIVFIMGSLSAVNSIFMFLAYKNAPINILMPFTYIRLPIVTIGSYLVFGNKLTLRDLIGFFIITLSSGLIFYIQNTGQLKINVTK